MPTTISGTLENTSGNVSIPIYTPEKPRNLAVHSIIFNEIDIQNYNESSQNQLWMYSDYTDVNIKCPETSYNHINLIGNTIIDGDLSCQKTITSVSFESVDMSYSGKLYLGKSNNSNEKNIIGNFSLSGSLFVDQITSTGGQINGTLITDTCFNTGFINNSIIGNESSCNIFNSFLSNVKIGYINDLSLGIANQARFTNVVLNDLTIYNNLNINDIYLIKQTIGANNFLKINNSLNIEGDISCNTLKYISLDPPLSFTNYQDISIGTIDLCGNVNILNSNINFGSLDNSINNLYSNNLWCSSINSNDNINISGNINLLNSSNIIPNNLSNSNLGSSNNRFNNVYFNNLDISGISSSLIPNTHNLELGSSSNSFSKVNVVNISAESITTTQDITCRTLNYTNLNPPSNLIGYSDASLSNIDLSNGSKIAYVDPSNNILVNYTEIDYSNPNSIDLSGKLVNQYQDISSNGTLFFDLNPNKFYYLIISHLFSTGNDVTGLYLNISGEIDNEIDPYFNILFNYNFLKATTSAQIDNGDIIYNENNYFILNYHTSIGGNFRNTIISTRKNGFNKLYLNYDLKNIEFDFTLREVELNNSKHVFPQYLTSSLQYFEIIAPLHIQNGANINPSQITLNNILNDNGAYYGISLEKLNSGNNNIRIGNGIQSSGNNKLLLGNFLNSYNYPDNTAVIGNNYTKSIQPPFNRVTNLGDISNRYLTVYADNLDISGTSINKINNDIILNGDLNPTIDNSFNLGSNNYKWNNGVFENLVVNDISINNNFKVNSNNIISTSYTSNIINITLSTFTSYAISTINLTSTPTDISLTDIDKLLDGGNIILQITTNSTNISLSKNLLTSLNNNTYTNLSSTMILTNNNEIAVLTITKINNNFITSLSKYSK